jgi:hypothetical protein
VRGACKTLEAIMVVVVGLNYHRTHTCRSVMYRVQTIEQIFSIIDFTEYPTEKIFSILQVLK